jgi:adenylyltransferase/sulfurtransferase
MAAPGGPFLSGLHVVVIGAGGLGCAVLPRLARMGIGRLTIVDGDRVEEKNLDRQPLYDLMDVGAPKASTAAAWMRQIMASGAAVGRDLFLDASNAFELVESADVVVEGVDDLHAKQLIDRACAELGVPLVSGGVHQQQGQVIVLHAPGEATTLSRADLFAGKPGSEQDGCDMRDVSVDLLEEVGRRMASLARSILRGETVRNGVVELFSGKGWLSIEPPR